MVDPDIGWLARFITEDPETFQEDLEEEPVEAPIEEPRQASDVQRASQKMEKSSGLEALLGKINNRVELEQFLLSILKSVNVRPGDMYSALVKAAKKAKEM